MYYSLGLGQGQFFLDLTRLSGCQYQKALTESNVRVFIFKVEIFHPNDVANVSSKMPSVKTRSRRLSLLSAFLFPQSNFLNLTLFFQIIVFVW